MPYDVVKVSREGYKVCKPDSEKCFSKKPLTLEKAKQQQKALYANETKKRGKQLDSLSNMPTGKYTVVMSKSVPGPPTFTGSKRDVANFVARAVGEPPLSILNRISANGTSTFGSPVKAVVSPAGMSGSGIFDWLKNKGSQLLQSAKTGVSKLIDNVQNDAPATRTDIGDKFLAEQTKLFSPSGRPDEPGIPPEQVIQNFVPNPMMPDTKTLYQMNKNAYANSTEDVGGWKYMTGTPTIKIYNKGHAMLVAVRGTADNRDILTDLTIAAQDMQSQKRYTEDRQFIQQFQTDYPQGQYVYLLTGHSLGGAICDELIKDGLATQAITFNPAVQKWAYDSQSNKRIYQQDDPLYRMMGRYCRYNVEVRTTRSKSAVESALSFVPVAGVGYTAMQAHSLDNYVGGMMFPTSIEDRPFMRPLSVPFRSTMVGSGRAYTAAEWEAKLCSGENSLLEQKKRKIEEREARRQARQPRQPRPRVKEEPDIIFTGRTAPRAVEYTGSSKFERWIRDLLQTGHVDMHSDEDTWTYANVSPLQTAAFLVDYLKNHKYLLFPTELAPLSEALKRSIQNIPAIKDNYNNLSIYNNTSAQDGHVKKFLGQLTYALATLTPETKDLPFVVYLGLPSHATLLIVDPKHKKLYHYDPHGVSERATMVDHYCSWMARNINRVADPWEYISSERLHDIANVDGFQADEAQVANKRPRIFKNAGSCTDWTKFVSLAILKQADEGNDLNNPFRIASFLENVDKILEKIYSEKPRRKQIDDWIMEKRLRLVFGVQEEFLKYLKSRWDLTIEDIADAADMFETDKIAEVSEQMFESLTAVYRSQLRGNFIPLPRKQEADDASEFRLLADDW